MVRMRDPMELLAEGALEPAERTPRTRPGASLVNPVRVASGAQGQLIQPVTVPLSSNDPPGVD